MEVYEKKFLVYGNSGADPGFSRGGGGADSQKVRKFFFRSTELIFRVLPKLGLVSVLVKFSAPQAKR